MNSDYDNYAKEETIKKFSQPRHEWPCMKKQQIVKLLPGNVSGFNCPDFDEKFSLCISCNFVHKKLVEK